MTVVVAALDRIALSMPRLPAIRQGLVSALKAGTMWSDEAESGSNSSISTSCLRSQQMARASEQHRFRALTKTTCTLRQCETLSAPIRRSQIVRPLALQVYRNHARALPRTFGSRAGGVLAGAKESRRARSGSCIHSGPTECTVN
jgi:hypothetical protein